MNEKLRRQLPSIYRVKPVEVLSADDGKPTHLVLGLWTATALVLLLGKKKLNDESILKAYSVTMSLFPLV